MSYKSDINNIDYFCVTKIFESRTIDEIKTAARAFIAAADEVRETYNGMFVYMLCRRFEETFSEWSKQYSALAKNAAWNAVIIPPEHSPIMLLPSCVPFGSSPNEIIAGLEKFITRCDEFTPPIFDTITVIEIKKVLTAVQKSYGLLDIIAPNEPIKILCFTNSHNEYNSQCGFPSEPTRPPTIFLYHPKENGTYDRVFIFAHELGHALHWVLTRNADVLPDGFDKFNESVFARFDTLKEKQEAFADAVAFAILNVKGLGTHFPNQFSKERSPVFAKYIKELTTNK